MSISTKCLKQFHAAVNTLRRNQLDAGESISADMELSILQTKQIYDNRYNPQFTRDSFHFAGRNKLWYDSIQNDDERIGSWRRRHGR